MDTLLAAAAAATMIGGPGRCFHQPPESSLSIKDPVLRNILFNGDGNHFLVAMIQVIRIR
ncbi:MAG: hypothetical protein JXA20_11580 [Spirochaetes bacterium]|nr:hypothetical protein [Spirochaetota bacterium]